MSATPEDRVFARRADDRLAAARDQFSPDPGFLDTASAGLPTAGTLAALARALEVWRPGRATPQSYDAAVAAARDRFARLVGVPVDRVAVGSQSSPFAGLVAASLPDGAEVVLPDCDFTSVVFPFLAQQVRGVRVRLVPLEALPEAVSEHTTLVVCSLVQSCDGRLVDLAAIRAVAAASGARVLLDVTQSAGWLPVDISDIDYVVCSAYKWLLCPRGVAFFVIRPERVAELTPVFANWYAGEDPWTSIYGGPLRLATTARRFDLSPAWLA
jgi:selenocysteine lyase/cysteine desulfurase